MFPTRNQIDHFSPPLRTPLGILPRDPKLPPNVVVILLNDLGHRVAEPYGSTFYEAPTISRLVKEGVGGLRVFGGATVIVCQYRIHAHSCERIPVNISSLFLDCSPSVGFWAEAV